MSYYSYFIDLKARKYLNAIGGTLIHKNRKMKRGGEEEE